jgi:hypothetical protein
VQWTIIWSDIWFYEGGRRGKKGNWRKRGEKRSEVLYPSTKLHTYRETTSDLTFGSMRQREGGEGKQ